MNNISLIACSDTKINDINNFHKGVHFFKDDYHFENIYRNPSRTLQKFRNYRFMLTPDYSLYNEMPRWMQIEAIGKSRWIGAYWQHNGVKVVPTITWGNPSSYQFCFDSIEKHSIVAIGTIGCKKYKFAFMRGYEAMMNIIKPSAIICFGHPFPDMEGKIIVVNYISSKKVVRHGWQRNICIG